MGAPGTQPRPLAPGRAALALAALLLLLGAPFALGGPWNLSSFQLCRFLFFKEVKDNASGAAYMPETNTLWIVLNNPPRLLEYDTDARMMRRLDTKWLLDPEDVVYISKDRIAVSEEPMEGEIRILDVSEAGAGRQLAAYPANNPRSSGSGNEGLSYNPRSGAFIAAQEKGPKRIVSVRPTAGGGSNWSTLVNGDESFPMLEDLAAVNYIEQLDQLFVLSQESRRLVRSTMDGRVLEQMDVVGSRPEPNEMAVYRSDACRPGEDGWAAAAGKPVGPDPEPKKGGGGGGRGKGGGGGIESRLAQLLK